MILLINLKNFLEDKQKKFIFFNLYSIILIVLQKKAYNFNGSDNMNYSIIKKLKRRKNAKEIYEFLNNNMYIEQQYMDELVKVMCDLNDLYYICKTIKILTLSNENLVDLIDIVINSKKVSYIKNILENTFNADYAIKKICKLKDSYIICELLICSEEILKEYNITRLVTALCELKEYRYILKISSLKKLSENNVINLVDVLIENDKILELVEFVNNCTLLPKSKFDEIIQIVKNSNHIPSMFTLAKIYYDRYNEINKKLIENIILLKNMKYICLVAVYIDNSLIYKLFDNVNSMYQYMCTSLYYSSFELKNIANAIYGENLIEEHKKLLKRTDKIKY